jgi:hypothetical protein
MSEYARKNAFFGSGAEFRESILFFFAETWTPMRPHRSSRANDSFQIIKKSSFSP